MRWPEVRHAVTKRLQGICWVYLTTNFSISSMSNLAPVEPRAKCVFTSITMSNYVRVQDFREESRVSEYRDKLARGEIGFFVECDGKMIGSIWASINRARKPTVIRMHMRLLPNEALIHDIVTSDGFRGMGIGPFMVGRIAAILLGLYGVDKIVVDVNSRNRPSLRMMEKAGLRAKEQVMYISMFGKLVVEKTLRQDPAAC